MDFRLFQAFFHGSVLLTYFYTLNQIFCQIRINSFNVSILFQSDKKEFRIGLTAFQSKQLKEWFPDGSIPTPESMERKRDRLSEQRKEKHEQYKALKTQTSELNYARQALDDYLRNERALQEKKRKKGDLE